MATAVPGAGVMQVMKSRSSPNKAIMSCWKDQCFDINNFAGIVRNEGFQ